MLDVGEGDGRAHCQLHLTETHLNRQGALHGGLSAAILDNAMGATATGVFKRVPPTGGKQAPAPAAPEPGHIRVTRPFPFTFGKILIPRASQVRGRG